MLLYCFGDGTVLTIFSFSEIIDEFFLVSLSMSECSWSLNFEVPANEELTFEV